jgi:hypothetical protein
MRHDTDPSPESDPPATRRRDNFIDGASWRSRFFLAIVFLGAFVPLYLVLFEPDETKKIPLWQQWLCVAVFTPMGLIGEWLVFTARRPSPAKR